MGQRWPSGVTRFTGRPCHGHGCSDRMWWQGCGVQLHHRAGSMAQVVGRAGPAVGWYLLRQLGPGRSRFARWLPLQHRLALHAGVAGGLPRGCAQAPAVCRRPRPLHGLWSNRTAGHDVTPDRRCPWRGLGEADLPGHGLRASAQRTWRPAPAAQAYARPLATQVAGSCGADGEQPVRAAEP
ncbi:hypothetical protein D9M73_175030 [compost metagenome]